jgi:cAMP phosphodiesterase
MKAFFVFCLLLNLQGFSQSAFRVVPLGILGGLDESNLSAYMVAPAGTTDYLCFDAGTIHAGIQKAIANHSFNADAATVLRQYIKAYFISHAHLDHVAGLVMNSPADSSKTVYALPIVMQHLQDSYFNGDAWANFGDEGKSFLIKKYHFEKLDTGVSIPVVQTRMQVKAFTLSHIKPYQSTAFLVNDHDNYVLYLGDTGADIIEHANNLDLLWREIAPLIKTNKLKGIFIEVSYPDAQPQDKLFGHLTPKLLMKEMENLCAYTGRKSLAGIKLVITHMKPPAESFSVIQRELEQQNKLGFKLIFPVQGLAFTL